MQQRQPLEQPDQLEITPPLALQSARRAHLVEIAVQIKLQQVGRIVRRLPNSLPTIGMPEPELRQIESTHIALDRPHPDCPSRRNLQPAQKKTTLLPARAGLEHAIRQ